MSVADVKPLVCTVNDAIRGRKSRSCIRRSLYFRIPNLEPDKQGPVLALKARSLLPYCHFELEDSDYIRSARRNPELRGPHGAPAGTTLDPNTRVLEMATIGVGVKVKRSFHIVNPTSEEYSFEWLNDDEPNLREEPRFTCLTPRGRIRSGKKTQVDFEFASTSLELVESFWKFVIPEQNITVPFLLVGTTNDPNVAFERSHLNFKALLIGEWCRPRSRDQALCFLSSFACVGGEVKEATLAPPMKFENNDVVCCN